MLVLLPKKTEQDDAGYGTVIEIISRLLNLLQLKENYNDFLQPKKANTV